jgi:hypothetical protein
MSDTIENIILEAISFYDPLTKDKIILDLDEYKITEVNEFSLEEFEGCFKKLLKEEKIKQIKVGPDIAYLRVFPKRRSWLVQKVINFFKFK